MAIFSSSSDITFGLGLSKASLDVTIRCIKSSLGAVVWRLQDMVAVLGWVEVATYEVVLNSQAIYKKLAGLSRLVRNQVFNMQSSIKKATLAFH